MHMNAKAKPKIAVITNCTASSNFEPLLDIADAVPYKTMDELLVWWTTSMRSIQAEQPDAMVTPGALYKGMSFDTIVEITQSIGHENVYVVNRGAGLVRYTDMMIPYNFYYDKGEEGSASMKVTGEKFIPTLWWSKLNKMLYGVEYPISAIAEDYDHIVVALTSNFIRMIAVDLSMIQNMKDRLFIPIPISNATSMPRKIRPAAVPYTKAYVQDLEYTHYTKAHVVAKKFLMMGLDSGNMIAHAQALRDVQSVMEGNGEETNVNYGEIFKTYPELLKAPNADTAYSQGQIRGLRLGSSSRFIGAWRGANSSLEVSTSNEEKATALTSLRAILQGSETRQQGTEVLLTRIGVFIEAVKAEQPDLIFTPRDIANWGKLAYGLEDVPKRQLRGTIGSGGKVAGTLRAYETYLGLESLDVGGNTAYRIMTTKDK